VTLEPAALYPSSRDRAVAIGAWLIVALFSAFLIAAVKYGSGDPDSKLYAGISARMAQLPVERWIAPEWWGLWGLTGPYQEHPIGMFVLPALLARAGYPAEQAAYAVNGFFQILCFALMAAIGAAVIVPRDARALAWVLQLLPIAFVFRVRANQEYTMLAGLLLALYGTERARRQPAWVIVMLAGFAWVLFVKGVFAFMVPLVCAVWLIARTTGRDEARRNWPVVVGVLAMPAVGALLAVAYDAAYMQVTGSSFLAAYRARQVPEGALTGGSAPVRIVYQLVWYAGRVIWYAVPWSLAAILLAFHRRDRDASRSSDDLRSEPARRGAWFALASSALLVLVFSLAHRKADRYIFPVYFIVAGAGAAYVMRRSPRFAAAVERLDRPWVPAAAWLALFLLRLATLGKLPEFTFWRS
jgi:4-amino-4-deoxy-L-arabinose transferase-like glycosyltransferase